MADSAVLDGPWTDYAAPAQQADGPWIDYAPKASPSVPTPAPVTPQSIAQDNAGTEVPQPKPVSVGSSGPPVGMDRSGPPAYAPPSAGDIGPSSPPSTGSESGGIISTIPIDRVAGIRRMAPAAPPPMQPEQSPWDVFKEVATHPLETLTGADLPSQQQEKMERVQKVGQETNDPFISAAPALEATQHQPTIKPTILPGYDKLDPHSKNIMSRALRGGADGIAALSSPDNLGLFAGMYFLPEEASHLISGVFSAQMGQGAVSGGIETIAAARRGDYGEAAERGANALLSAAFAVASGKHALGIEKSPSIKDAAASGLEEGAKDVMGAGPHGPWEDYGSRPATPPVTPTPQDSTRTFTAPVNAARVSADVAPAVKFDTGPFDFSHMERPVVQGSANPEEIRASAKAQEKPTVAAVEKAVEGVEGAEVTGSRVKDSESQQNKADRDKPVETQKDHLGVRVAADTPEAQTAAVGKIAETMPVVGTEPLDNNGLKGTQVFVRTGKEGDANQTSEVQVLPAAQVEALKKTDALYDQQKQALAAGDQAKADELGARIEKIHAAAMSASAVKSDDIGSKGETKPAERETKYEFGSTQANLPETSQAHQAIVRMQESIPDADLAGDGKDIDVPHVTLRYGLRGEITPELRAFIESQAPFEASLGATQSFPPKDGATLSGNTEPAAVIMAPVESPELHRLNAEIEKVGDFKESDFPDYRPHVTVAYVKPEVADKYTGLVAAQGTTFPIDSIVISDKNGEHTEIALKGESANPARRGGRGESPEPTGGGAGNALPPAETTQAVPVPRASTESTAVPKSEAGQPKEVARTGSTVELPDGRRGVVKGISPKGDVEVKLDAGGRTKSTRDQVKVIDPNAPTEGVTSGIPGHEKPAHGAIAVDFDKTLATYDGYKGPAVLGEPIAPQVDAVKKMLGAGEDVWIFSARVAHPEAVAAIKAWTKEHIGQDLPVTNVKYPEFARFIDDRAELPVQMQEGVKDADQSNAKTEGDAPRPDEAANGGDRGKSQAEQHPEVQGNGGQEEGLVERFKAQTEARKPKPLAPGEIGRMPLADLSLDPKTFQYKLNTDASGATNKLRDVPWNDALSGVITAWRSPDGKAYVVNGHHRYERAATAKAPDLAVRMLPDDVKTPQEARIVGALQNIAEGNGTAVDAAKFLRDTTYTPEDLARYGVSLSGPVAEGGAALARLDPKIFDDVVAGRIPERRGIAIGTAAETPAQQEALLKMIERAETKGRTVTNATIEELGRMVKGTQDVTTTQDSLFGTETRTQNLALEKAEVSAYLRGQIASEKKLFGGLTSAAKAETLGTAGNRIDTKKNVTVAERAEQAQEIYDRLSTRTGPVDDILNAAAKRIAGGENANTVKSEAYRSLRAALSEALRGGQEAAGRSGQEDTARPETLPGLEQDVQRQQESAADVQRENTEAVLQSPQGNIDRATGEMERESPLFRDSEASGQGGLFGGEEGFLDVGPLVDMAAPLRNELERRSEVADVANNVHDVLTRLDRSNKATTLEAKGIARSFQDSGFSKEDGDKVFASIEDPAVKLTPDQINLKYKWIVPLDKRAAQQRAVTLLIKSLSDKDAQKRRAKEGTEFTLEDILAGKVPQEEIDRVAPEQPNYQHRIAVDKNTLVDRILGDSMKRFRAGGSALSRTFSSGNRSVFYEIHGPDGEREAVAVKGGRVTRFRMGPDGKPVVEDLGAFRSGLTDAGKETDERMAPFVQRITELREEIAGMPEADKQEQLADVQKRIKDLEKQVDLLNKVKAPVGRTSAFGGKVVYSTEPTFRQRAEISRKLDLLRKKEERLKAGTEPMLAKNQRKLEARKEELAGNEDFRDEVLNDGEKLEGQTWKDKNGDQWKFDRGTTKFITERTGQKYHDNAMLSSLVNWMETNKAMNAAIVMERMKGILKDQGMAVQSDNPLTVPDGWKGTTLQQMRGYYFPTHVAESLDQYASLQSRGQANIAEKANRFMIQTVLMNPLMHGKNILANWFTGKAAEAITGRALVPRWYGENAKAGVKAVNTLKDIGGTEYRRLLRLGLDLQGANTSFDQTTKEILRGFTEQLAAEPEQNKALSALMGVADAGKWLQTQNHLATFGLNDLFLLQSFYAREAQLEREGMDPEKAEMAARDWAHLQVAEYTTPIRVGGSAALGRLLENPNLSAFWRYHFGGILRPVMNAVKESVGSFRPDESASAGGEERNSRGQTASQSRINAIARLVVMTAFATVVFPKILDKLAKKITGDEQAKFPRGGTLGFASNIAETVKGERTTASTLSSVFTPALGTEELAEIGINRDFFTGRHIMGTNVGAEDKAKQLAAWLSQKSMPGQLTHRIDQGKGKQALFSLLGFTFPMEHGLLEAAKIRSEAAGSIPPDPKQAKVWQSILAAAEQAQRSGGRDTRLKDALLHSGQLKHSQRKELIAASHEAPIVFATSDLEHDADVWQVFEHSTDEEKAQLIHNSKTHAKMLKYEKQLRKDGDVDKAEKVKRAITR